MLNAVGIDASKGQSTISILRPAGEIVRKLFNVVHSVKELSELVSFVGSLEGETRVVMETTGHYHEPILKAFLDSGILSLPLILLLSSVMTVMKIHFARSSQILRMPEKSPSIPLTSGSICISIQLWILLEHN